MYKRINRNQTREFNKWTSISRKPRKRTKRKPKGKLKRVEHFHRYKHRIPGIILRAVDDKEIIYGARALNKRFPSFLDVPTQDYDIYTPHPKRDAREVEKALDKEFGGDFFYVTKAQCPRTWRVRSHVNDEVYADYTKPEEKIPYDTIGGRNYVTLKHTKKHIERTLNDPSSEFRHAKDRDALNRIKIYEKILEDI